MASIMSAPDYSMAATSRSRLSIRLPRESLYSSLQASSQYFHFDSETARLARNANQWLTSNRDSNKDDSGVSRPSSIAPSHFSVRSLPIDYEVPEPDRRPHPVMGSVRYSDIRPRSAAPTESTEKLQPSPGGVREDATNVVDDTVYPTGMKLALITLALCLAVFVMALGE